MASQSWGQLIASIPTAGFAYNTYTTAKSVLTSATATGASVGFISLPPGFFSQAGGKIEIDFLASVSSATGNTMTFQVMVGAVIAFTTGAVSVSTATVTTEPLWGRAVLTVQAVGNGTQAKLMGAMTMMGQMIASGGAAAGAVGAAGMGFGIFPNAIPALGTGFDSTVVNTLDFWVGMGTSAAGNQFQLMDYTVRSWGNSAF